MRSDSSSSGKDSTEPKALTTKARLDTSSDDAAIDSSTVSQGHDDDGGEGNASAQHQDEGSDSGDAGTSLKRTPARPMRDGDALGSQSSMGLPVDVSRRRHASTTSSVPPNSPAIFDKMPPLTTDDEHTKRDPVLSAVNQKEGSGGSAALLKPKGNGAGSQSPATQSSDGDSEGESSFGLQYAPAARHAERRRTTGNNTDDADESFRTAFVSQHTRQAHFVDFKQKLQTTFFSFQKIFYPRRPLFTLLLAGVIAVTGYFSVMPLALAVWLGTNVMADDLIIYPLLRFLGFKRSIHNGQKVAKSLMGIGFTILGYAVGALIGYFVLLNIPMVTQVVTMMVNSFDWLTSFLNCSMALWALGSVVGASLARYFNFPTLIGVFLGSLVALFIPVTIPIPVDIIIVTALFFGFAFNYLSKQAIRLGYWLAYGHTNADGYLYAHKDVIGCENQKPTQLDKTQADALGFKDKPSLIVRVRDHLDTVLETIKKSTNFLNSLTGSRQDISDSFKDLRHLLYTAKDDSAKAQLAELLNRSLRVADQPMHFDSTGFGGEAGLRIRLKEYKNLTNYDWRVKNNYNPGHAALDDDQKQYEQLQRIISKVDRSHETFSSLFNENYKVRFEHYMLRYERGFEAGLSMCEKFDKTKGIASKYIKDVRALLRAMKFEPVVGEKSEDKDLLTLSSAPRSHSAASPVA